MDNAKLHTIEIDGLDTVTRAVTTAQVSEIVLRCFAEKTQCRIKDAFGERVGECWHDRTQATPWNYWLNEN